MTDSEASEIRNALWDVGFDGEQSAERGPVMLKVLKLIGESRAERDRYKAAIESIEWVTNYNDGSKDTCKIDRSLVEAAVATSNKCDEAQK